MIRLSIAALLLAVFANVISNILFKRGMQDARGETVRETVFAALTSGAIWAGFLCAGVLLVSYLFAIRTLPLGASYATVTALTIAILTAWGIVTGTEPADPVRLAGIGAIVFGFVLVTVSLGRA